MAHPKAALLVGESLPQSNPEQHNAIPANAGVVVTMAAAAIILWSGYTYILFHDWECNNYGEIFSSRVAVLARPQGGSIQNPRTEYFPILHDPKVSLTNARKNIKSEFLLLDIVSKLFGGKLEGLGGSFPPPPPPPPPSRWNPVWLASSDPQTTDIHIYHNIILWVWAGLASHSWPQSWCAPEVRPVHIILIFSPIILFRISQILHLLFSYYSRLFPSILMLHFPVKRVL